jgi:hypothetical protein
MRRLSLCSFFFACQIAVAPAAPDLCHSAANRLENSLRAFRPSGEAPSIRNAVEKRPAAGLDYGSELDDETLRTFPLSDNDRDLFRNSVRRIFRAGGATGLAMLDAESGSAHCHTPFLFILAGPEPKPIAIPAVGDPFDLCAHGGVLLGALGGTPFYAQSDDHLDTDSLKLFTLSGGALTKACVIAARYSVSNRVVEKACAQPGFCAAFAGRAALWAQQFHDGRKRIADTVLTPSEPGALSEDDHAVFPTLGAGRSHIVPEPFRFDGKEVWFALNGEAADAVRIGAAAQGPANMADWERFTLVALYKAGHPVASFVIERRRGALRSIFVRDIAETAR